MVGGWGARLVSFAKFGCHSELRWSHKATSAASTKHFQFHNFFEMFSDFESVWIVGSDTMPIVWGVVGLQRAPTSILISTDFGKFGDFAWLDGCWVLLV